MYSFLVINLLAKCYVFNFEACKARNIIPITADESNKMIEQSPRLQNALKSRENYHNQ